MLSIIKYVVVLKITQSKSFDKMDKTLISDLNQMCPFIHVINLDFIVIIGTNFIFVDFIDV